jgi:hypothetical protein
MARTNLHELANRLLDALHQAAQGQRFEGKLRQVASDAGLNSVRSAEAVKLLEDLGRIEVIQRGRRGRDTIVSINSTDRVTLEDAESMLGTRSGKRGPKLSYDEIGRAVVERMLELARDDGLREAQVDAFARESEASKQRLQELEDALEEAARRETDLRIKLKAAEEALVRAEENLRRAFGPQVAPRPEEANAVPDDEARAVLDILRSRRI